MGGAWRWWFSRVAVGGAHCEGEAGAVCAGSVVAAQRGEGELRLVSVDHDEDCVHFTAVMVVVVLAVFDVGVHDAGVVVSALVGVFEVIPAVHASHAAFVAFDGERVAVVEGEGGGAYFVVGGGNVGDASASENLCVFFRGAVFVEDCRVGVHGWLVGPRAGWWLFARERAGLGCLWATGWGGVVRSAWCVDGVCVGRVPRARVFM